MAFALDQREGVGVAVSTLTSGDEVLERKPWMTFSTIHRRQGQMKNM